ncbi:methyltransferase domain-containing protein [Terasakiella sp. A23]|uniref:methyltransferase domain-containing protein n=1 Tax=Terasakiella sp. FCG-A23 TaxID=3080561 RepID=UPI0029558E9B|nr:methyltransferase domain-containing protein [Terasakiella sp. A23]MDV7340071.1 methyltransferase domain-containing protein [Terasakiella sp. A23]
MSDIEIMNVFDRQMVREHRDRAAKTWADFDFLHKEVAERICDRLDDVVRDFPLALDIGCHGGDIAEVIGKRGKVETLIQCDLSEGMARRADAQKATTLVADEEFLPFGHEKFDLIISNLSLHWVNDLPGALLQINRALKPDGLFIGTMFGIETLRELRQCLSDAELAVDGGMSPRISPFADVRDAGMLLQRAGFNLPVVDADGIEVRYENPMKLMKDLKGMGENNKVLERRKNFTKRELIMQAMQRYMEEFAGDDGRVPATFQVMYLTAWKPDPSQQKPMKPGTADKKLAEALGVPEHILQGKDKP